MKMIFPFLTLWLNGKKLNLALLFLLFPTLCVSQELGVSSEYRVFSQGLEKCHETKDVQTLLNKYLASSSIFFNERGISPEERAKRAEIIAHRDSFFVILASKKERKISEENFFQTPIEELEVKLKSSNKETRLNAAKAIIQKSIPNITPVIKNYLKIWASDDDDSLRALTATSIIKFSEFPFEFKEIISKLLFDRCATVRCNSALALSEKKIPDAMPLLIKALQDKDESTRANVAGAFAHYEVIGIPSIPFLVEIFQRRNDFASSASLFSFFKLFSLSLSINFPGMMNIPQIPFK